MHPFAPVGIHTNPRERGWGASLKNESFYSFECWNCSKAVELQARDGVFKCPHCDVRLHVEWHSARAEVERLQS